MIDFLIKHKDAILTVQSIVATIAYIIAGIWAIRRISYERPFQSLLSIESSSKCSRINPNLFLLHVQITVKNEGHAVVAYGDTSDPEYKSTIIVKGIKSDITLPEEITLQPGETSKFITWKPIKTAKFITWENERFFVPLFDGPFNELFQDWFRGGSTSVTLEGGESEQYSFDCLVSSDISEVSLAVTIYETTIKDKKLGRPYYWLIEEVFPLTATTTDNNQ